MGPSLCPLHCRAYFYPLYQRVPVMLLIIFHIFIFCLFYIIQVPWPLFRTSPMNNDVFCFSYTLFCLHNASNNLVKNLRCWSFFNYPQFLTSFRIKFQTITFELVYDLAPVQLYLKTRNLLNYLQMLVYSRAWLAFMPLYKLCILPEVLILHSSTSNPTFITWLTPTDSTIWGSGISELPSKMNCSHTFRFLIILNAIILSELQAIVN